MTSMVHKWTWYQPVFPGGQTKLYGKWFPYLRIDHVRAGEWAADHAAELDATRRIVAHAQAQAALERAKKALIYTCTLIAVRAPESPT